MFFGFLNSRLSLLATILALIGNFSFSIFAMAESPYHGTPSVFIPYSNAHKNHDLAKSPKINVGFNGSHHHVPFVMDTGSVGIIASADHFTPAPGAQNLGQGQQYYSSSGIIEEGTWWSATQQFYDAEGRLIATSNVPVLQVTSIRCAENARLCHAKNHPRGVAMMGIGFARKSDQQPRGTPGYNPFLNIQKVMHNGMLRDLPSDWVNGYVVTPHGIHLGLTAANTANAGFVKLLPAPEHSTVKLPEWKPSPMTLVVNGVSGTGNILMDTGVGAAYLTPPPNANLGELVTCSKTSKPRCVSDSGTQNKLQCPCLL